MVDRRRQQGADNGPRPGRAPGDEGLHAQFVEGHGEDRAHGRAHSLDRIGVTAVPHQDYPAAAGGVRRAHDGPEIAGIPHRLKRHPAACGFGDQTGDIREHLREYRHHHLRIVPPADLLQNVPADLDYVAAGGQGGLGDPLQHGNGRRLGPEEQDARRAANLQGLAHQFQPLGQKQSRLLPLLAQMQGAHGLDRGVGQGSDLTDRHFALHRAKNDSPTPRSPASSISASSPQSIRPPRSDRAWLISPAMERPDIRSA